MRRGLASLIMALSLLVATASWAGFVLTRTALDPGRSERLAQHLFDNEDVRAMIVDRLADQIEAQIPPDLPVPRQTIEQAADNALDDPRVEAVVLDGIVRTHQNALNGVDEPVMLDATALGQVGREMVVAARPQLDSILPPAPQLEVELPSTGLSWLGSVRSTVISFTRISAVVALAGLVLAFVLARNRPAALRRVAYWAFGASAFWIATAYAIPWILSQVAPSSVSIASAVIDVFFGALIPPAVTLAAVGVALLVIGLAWPALARRRPAALLDKSAPEPQPQYHQPPEPQYRAAPEPQYQAAPEPQYHQPAEPQYHQPAEPQYRAAPEPQYHQPAEAVRAAELGVDRTQVWSPGLVQSAAQPPSWAANPTSDPTPADQADPAALVTEPAPAQPGAGADTVHAPVDQADDPWVEGVGYVEPDQTPPPPVDPDQTIRWDR